jgi:hypothetical protein
VRNQTKNGILPMALFEIGGVGSWHLFTAAWRVANLLARKRKFTDLSKIAVDERAEDGVGC